MIKKLKPKKDTNFNNDEYYYDFLTIEEDGTERNLNFPFLFLGFEDNARITEDDGRQYKKDGGFVKLNVQSAGISCHQHSYTGWVLEPLNAKVYEGMISLNNRYLDSCIAEHASLKTVNEYNQYLKDHLDVESQSRYYLFEEAVYPVDNQYISKLSHVKDLKKFLKSKISYETVGKKSIFDNMRPFWDLQAVQLYIFGENCD
jgi:hypothetical protein